MAGRIIHDVSQGIVAVGAGGVVQVASTTGLYEKAYGYVFLAGQPGETVRIDRVLDATHVTLLLVRERRGNSILGTPMVLSSGDYTHFAPTAYVGGILSLPEQVVQNPNDQPLA
jgi:hypothetical protein